MEYLDNLLHALTEQEQRRDRAVRDLLAVVNEQIQMQRKTFRNVSASEEEALLQECNQLEQWLCDCRALYGRLRDAVASLRADFVPRSDAPLRKCEALFRELSDVSERCSCVVEWIGAQLRESECFHASLKEEKAAELTDSCLREGNRLKTLCDSAVVWIQEWFAIYSCASDVSSPFADDLSIQLETVFQKTSSSPAKSHPDWGNASDMDSRLEPGSGVKTPAPAWGAPSILDRGEETSAPGWGAPLSSDRGGEAPASGWGAFSSPNRGEDPTIPAWGAPLSSDRGGEASAPGWGTFWNPNTSNEPAHPAPVPGVQAPLPYIDEQKKPVEIQKVEFSCLAPKTLARGDYTIIQVIMYEPLYRHIVEEMRAEMEEPAQEKRSGMHEISANSEIRVVLSSPDFAIEDNTETGIWRGEHLDFSFAVMLPEEYRKRQALFVAMVYVNDLIATKLKFVVKCTAPSQQEAEVTREDILSAFVSYASQDRGRVAAIIQGMQKARPDIDVFFDVDSLRSGENWEAALHREIDKRDVLFLCWSQFARKSKWVEAEWRYALERKGLDCIEPVPIEPPDVCPPPEELSKKHFNDKLLFVINTYSNNGKDFNY